MNTADQVDRAEAFRQLHVRGKPIVLFNIWDAGSAKAVAASGARALATGSWSVAAAFGFEDGEHVPLELVLENVQRIIRSTDLPLTVDLESGYGADPRGVGQTLSRAISAGAIGCNLEDSVPATGQLRDIADQTARLEQARAAAGTARVPAFVNARTDVFLRTPADQHEALVPAALERARAYAAAGADSLFVPGLADERLIGRVVAESPLPVNIMASDATPPLARLAALGVARVSHGPGPYRRMMRALEEAARAALT
ncbi:MAG TPA: isocitrate lyase/phosphoenolpyruvate mutase family protein [Steroidobacteraceae bacterium]|nr:isocitrate lyase/phosphoenolpyruvate mutase family protein [Steroidobacteraceae bacterium]